MGVTVAALTAYDIDLDDGILEFLSPLVIVMALVYVGAAALDRRRSAWAVFLAAFVLVAIMRPLDLAIYSSVVLLVAALVFVVLGAARGLLRRPGGLTLQTAGMFVFGATAVAGLYLDPDLGGYLVAAALIGHAAWDAVHFLRNRVVARSYAEFCAILDLLVGATILLAMLLRTAAVRPSFEVPSLAPGRPVPEILGYETERKRKMRKPKCFVTCTADGFIAAEDGSTDAFVNDGDCFAELRRP